MTEYEAKVIFIGDSNVGKTCIIGQCTNGRFMGETTSTLSSNYSLVTVNTPESKIRFQLWDTAGDEKYRSIVPMFYRGSQAAVVVYSVDDRSTFDDIDYFVDSLKSNLDISAVALYLVANKVDLTARAVSPLEGEERAKAIGAAFMEVSAKTGENIQELVSLIAAGVGERKRTERVEGVDVGQEQTADGACC